MLSFAAVKRKLVFRASKLHSRLYVFLIEQTAFNVAAKRMWGQQATLNDGIDLITR